MFACFHDVFEVPNLESRFINDSSSERSVLLIARVGTRKNLILVSEFAFSCEPSFYVFGWDTVLKNLFLGSKKSQNENRELTF